MTQGSPTASRRTRTARKVLVQRLIRTTDMQVREIEARLKGELGEPDDRERDARIMAVLAKTTRELLTLETEGAAKKAPQADDEVPRDVDELRHELARRIDSLRGPQFTAAWLDELAKWRQAEAAFDMLQFGLRLGERPRQLITTTPRPIALIKRLVADPATAVTRAGTRANAYNLAPAFLG